MAAVVAELPAKPRRGSGGAGAEPAGEGLTAAFDKDQSRTFGGLRRVQAATGDFLWVCPDHYRGYDPGLPVIPQNQGMASPAPGPWVPGG
jgi:hypothetical protein